MKNYVAKLRENQEKGFSLVELIIVMAIMAILVGVVASQVIPYMEKSRQAKDQQVISALLTDINSGIAQSGEACVGGKAKLSALQSVTNAAAVAEVLELRPGNSDMTALETTLTKQVKSKEFGSKEIWVEVDATTGKTTVYFSKDTSGTKMSNKKSIASTEED